MGIANHLSKNLYDAALHKYATDNKFRRRVDSIVSIVGSNLPQPKLPEHLVLSPEYTQHIAVASIAVTCYLHEVANIQMKTYIEER